MYVCVCEINYEGRSDRDAAREGTRTVCVRVCISDGSRGAIIMGTSLRHAHVIYEVIGKKLWIRCSADAQCG